MKLTEDQARELAELTDLFVANPNATTRDGVVAAIKAGRRVAWVSEQGVIYSEPSLGNMLGMVRGMDSRGVLLRMRKNKVKDVLVVRGNDGLAYATSMEAKLACGHPGCDHPLECMDHNAETSLWRFELEERRTRQ